MQVNNSFKRFSTRGLVLAVMALLVLGMLGLVAKNGFASDKALPPAIANQVTYAVYMPGDETVAVIDRESISFQADAELLSYTAALTSGSKIFVNQQPTPESFVDIPQAYDKLITSLQPYASFESLNGRVALTKPKEFSGRQSAVMNSKGTLMFIRSDVTLSDDQWRKVFNNLKII